MTADGRTVLSEHAHFQLTRVHTHARTQGYIDVLISSLEAVQPLGADYANAEVVTYGGLWLLKVLDGEAIGQVEDKLRASPVMLRYMVDSNIVSLAYLGQTSGTLGTMLAVRLLIPIVLSKATCKNVLLLMILPLTN